MAEKSKEIKSKIDKSKKDESEAAYKFRQMCKLMRKVLDVMKGTVGKEIIEKLESECDVDLDGDGNIGSAKVKLLCLMASIGLLAAGAFAGTTTWIPFDQGVYGIMTITGNDSTKVTSLAVSNITANSFTAVNTNELIIGDLTVNGTLDVGGASSFTGTVTTTAGAVVGTTLSVGTTLGVVGAATFNDTVDIDGNTTVTGTLHSVGAATFDGAVDIDGATTITGAVTTIAGLTVGTTLGVGTTAVFNDTVDIDGATTITGAVTHVSTLTQTGDATFTADMISTPVEIAVGGLIVTQTVNATFYVLEPSGIYSQRLANASSPGQVVTFFNNAATSVVFETGQSNVDVGASDITLGATDAITLRSVGTTWYRMSNIDN